MDKWYLGIQSSIKYKMEEVGKEESKLMDSVVGE